MECLVSRLKSMVLAFDCGEGLPESVYDATCDMLEAVLGQDAVAIFRSSIRATEGRFYFKDELTDTSKRVSARCWQLIVESVGIWFS